MWLAQTDDTAPTPVTQPPTSMGTIARAFTALRKHKPSAAQTSIAINTHDRQAQTDSHMWQRDSEMQTNDSYLRIARRLDSLRNRKGNTLNVMVAPPRKQATHK